MNEAYLVVKCKRCGSTSKVAFSGVRSEWSLCPVCLEGETECHADQPGIRLSRDAVQKIRKLNPYILDKIRFRPN